MGQRPARHQEPGRLLWRVRRKLLLVHLFLGVVPIVLVIAFALAGGVVVCDNLAALFHQGLRRHR